VPAENFLDYMHVNADGYRIVAARLFADLTELLRSPNPALDVR
jgi:lysophospholipase L1-like esterase